MHTLIDQDIAFVRKLLQLAIPRSMADVYLFGSRARGGARYYSDVDVAVLPKAPLPIGLLAELREKLAESNILLTVDLVDLSETDQAFRTSVLQQGQPWNA